jgi:hypothetical protein
MRHGFSPVQLQLSWSASSSSALPASALAIKPRKALVSFG